MTERDNRRFQKGSGTYQCMICDKMTRETGEGESDLELCLTCMKKELLYNELQDGAITDQEYKDRMAELEAK